MNAGTRGEARAACFLIWAATLLALAGIGYCVRMALKIDILYNAIRQLWALVR